MSVIGAGNTVESSWEIAIRRRQEAGAKIVRVASEIFTIQGLPADFVDDLGDVFDTGRWLALTPGIYIPADGLRLMTAATDTNPNNNSLAKGDQ